MNTEGEVQPEEEPENRVVGFVAEDAETALASASTIAGGKLEVSASSTFPAHISVSPTYPPGYVPVPGPPGPMGPMGPPAPAGPTIYTTGTSPALYTDEEEAREKAEREAELVMLPTKRPRKVLVAFFDDEDEDQNGEPFWAAFLEPDDMDLFLSPKDARDARMSLSLALRKRFAQ